MEKRKPEPLDEVERDRKKSKAPNVDLVLDMVRMTEVAMRRGESGPMGQLAPYFKSPIGVGDHDLHSQFHTMMEYFRKLGVQAS